MVNALEVPADRLIRRLAEYLRENVPEVKPPSWHIFVKTGCFKEKPPTDPDWWYTRAASIMRKLYKSGEPIGVGGFRVIWREAEEGCEASPLQESRWGCGEDDTASTRAGSAG